MDGVRGAFSVDHGVFQREKHVSRLPPAPFPALPGIVPAEIKNGFRQVDKLNVGRYLDIDIRTLDENFY